MTDLLQRITRLTEPQRALLRLRLGGIERAADGESRLVGYIVPHRQGSVVAQDLREFLGERLPEYMVPSAWTVIDSFPLTSRGKVDRKALLAMTQATPAAESGHSPPRNDSERAILKIWTEVLGLHVIGLEDNFFDLGGHSLLLPKVLTRVRELAGREVSMVDLFRYPTVQSLAGFVAGEQVPAGGEAIPEATKDKREAGVRRMKQQRRQRQAALRNE